MKAYMLCYRFNDIKSYFTSAFVSDSKTEADDPWYKIIELFDDFNKTRADVIKSCDLYVLDESMSAFRPRTTATGNLPHLSFVRRKPEPLGTEFKCIADALLGVILAIETTRKKTDETDLQYDDVRPKLPSSTKTSLRLVHESIRCSTQSTQGNNGNMNMIYPKTLVLGDSWFGNVPTCLELLKIHKMHSILIVKQGHKRYPKKFLDHTMKDWPSGSHMVLEAKIEGEDLIAMGYKYNSRSVIFFLASKGAAHTLPGIPYSADFIRSTDQHQCCRKIPRPHLASTYYLHNNKIDMHNHARQFELAIEKAWVTSDGYWRCFQTLLGITVCDAWKLYRHHLPNRSTDKDITMKDFGSIMALACLQNSYSSAPPDERHLFLPQDQEESINPPGPLPASIHLDEDTSNISNIVNSPPVNSPPATPQVARTASSIPTRKRLFDNGLKSVSSHVKVAHDRARCIRNTTTVTRSQEKNRGKRSVRIQRGRCIICTEEKRECRTEYFCSVCKFPVCQDGTGRDKRQCYSVHVKGRIGEELLEVWDAEQDSV